MDVPPLPPSGDAGYLPPAVPAAPEDDDAAYQRAQAAQARAERAQAESDRAERALAATAKYARDREAFQSVSRRYLLAVAIFVGAEVTMWVLRFRVRGQILQQESPDLRPWAVASFLVFFVSVALAAALLLALVRHTRRRPVLPFREIPLDDEERLPRTLRPGYEPPRRW